MIFNSIDFAFFFPIVFFLYWLVVQRHLKLRNGFIILVSYFFYGMWDWRFLVLILISSLVDYLAGIRLATEVHKTRRKWWLFASIVVNLGFLAFFKYFNFFIESFTQAFTLFGYHITYHHLNIILPVGISFYTFQTLSYTIDVYQRKLSPTKDALSFFAFVSFFPQLVAGPIERAKHLLPQFYTLKKPDYQDIKNGLLLVAVGLFKKIIIADRLAIFVNNAYAQSDNAPGIVLLLATIFFAFQLYLDFSAYSDIAIGVAQTLGFTLSANFRRPYLASSFSNFWERWHISLSSWFRDYLYIPLGGNKKGAWIKKRNIMIVFIVSGFWHGASWNFMIWGIINGTYLLLFDHLLLKTVKSRSIRSVFVVSCWVLSLVFFRASTLTEAIYVFQHLGFDGTQHLYNYGLNKFEFQLALILVTGGFILEFLKERKVDVLAWVLDRQLVIRYVFYVAIIICLLLFGANGSELNDSNFIYFQF